MPHAFINGINLYYESYGNGFPLVLAYGLGGNTGMWAGQIEAFSRHYHLILWDPRGHGQSDSPPHPDQYSLSISAEDLRGLLDHLGIERAYVGGQSMGGGIAARFALTYPNRVAALLIIDSASASGLPRSAAMREKTIELAETQGMAAVADYVITANPNLRTQAEAALAARQRLRQMFLDLNPTGYAHSIRALLEETFPTERLSTLTMPTLGVLVSMHGAGLYNDRYGTFRLAEQHFSASERALVDEFLAEQALFQQSLAERIRGRAQHTHITTDPQVWYNYLLFQVWDRLSFHPESGRLPGDFAPGAP